MPTLKNQERSERLEARITSDQKELFKRAAQVQGRSLTDFLVRAASEVADRVLQEEEVIKLSRKDQEFFVQALLNPPKPNAHLRAAFKHHREVIER